MELKINSPKYGERIVLIDDEDYERISKYKWHLGYEKNVDNFYILSNPIINKKQVTLRLHRLIMNAPKNLFVDHKNGDTTDNRKCNLRLCTRSQK